MNAEINYRREDDRTRTATTWLSLDFHALIERMPLTTRLELFAHAGFDLAVSDAFLASITGEYNTAPWTECDSWPSSHTRAHIAEKIKDLAPIAMIQLVEHLAGELQFAEDRNRRTQHQLHELQQAWDQQNRPDTRGANTEFSTPMTADEVLEKIRALDAETASQVDESQTLANALLEEIRDRAERLLESTEAA